jgi:hypothetical protein
MGLNGKLPYRDKTVSLPSPDCNLTEYMNISKKKKVSKKKNPKQK